MIGSREPSAQEIIIPQSEVRSMQNPGRSSGRFIAIVRYAGLLSVTATVVLAALWVQFGNSRSVGNGTVISKLERLETVRSKPVRVARNASTDIAGGLSENVVVGPAGDLQSATPPPVVPYTRPAGQPQWLITPCDAIEAGKIQQAWADHLQLPIEYTNSLGMRFRLIPPGEFDQGASAAELAEALTTIPANDTHWRECLQSATPKHRVVITRPFYLAIHEVTQQQYQQLIGINPAWYSTTGKEPHYVKQVEGIDTASHAVEGVTWNDAVNFCAKLSETNHGQPRLEYRLPTDSEWEFACRAGSTSKFWYGNTERDSEPKGWFSTSYGGRTHRVGEGEANALGLYDMNTNVWEWVSSRWHLEHYARINRLPAVDPIGADESQPYRIVRGGMWPDGSGRSFDRYAYEPTYQTFYVGFRVALSTEGVAEALQAVKGN